MKKAALAWRAAGDLLLAAVFFTLLLLRGQAVAAGVRQGLVTLGQTLIPALFPFLILSEWLMQSGAGKLLTRPFCGAVSKLTGLSRATASAFLIGLVCGTPVGCLFAAALWKKGEIGERDRDRLMLFSNNPGLGFMVGAAGAVCGDSRLGVVLWCLVTAAALTACALARLLFGKGPETANMPHNGIEKCGFDLPIYISAATANMVRVGGFFLAAAGLIGGLDALTGTWPLILRVGYKGLLELSAGVLAAGALSTRAAFLCCAFTAGFAGLTIALQLRSLAGEAAPPLPLYLSARLFVGALAVLFARAYLALFPVSAGAPPVYAEKANAMTPFLLLPFLLLLLLYTAARGFRRIRQK